MEQLSNKDFIEMSRHPLKKVLPIPFDEVKAEGDEYVFFISGEAFCSIPRRVFSGKQISFFESIKSKQIGRSAK